MSKYNFSLKATSGKTEMKESLIRIPIHQYIHVLDYNTNITKIEVGPQTYIRQENEKIQAGPLKMITIPPRYYCVIENPVVKENDSPVKDQYGQVKVQHADKEVRFTCDPFPLYPGEVLKEAVTPLRVVKSNTALKLKADEDFKDDDDIDRTAGDEWLFNGPATYKPRKEVSVIETVHAHIIGTNQALMLRAKKQMTDRNDVGRVTGETWLVKQVGAYIPGAYEEVVEKVTAYILTEKKALHMRALQTLTDFTNKKRYNGEEWLIQLSDTESHIPDVFEEVVGVVDVTTLTSRQYCVVLNPVDPNTGKNKLGSKKLIKGENSFFLQPGETLSAGIQNVFVLGEDEGLILRAVENFTDENDVERKPGDKWRIRGPCEYVPPVTVSVHAKRKAISLDKNEGIYVRNMKSGEVRSIIGETYMLTHEEELWSKILPDQVEKLLGIDVDPLADRALIAKKAARSSGGSEVNGCRDKTRVVTYRVQANSCVQVYDYKKQKSRVEFGPTLVMLEPEEQFTQISLSGGKPKKPNAIRSLSLLLGPDFCTDLIIVETSDHARLQLMLSYNWKFDVTQQVKDILDESMKLFCVPDFVGDMCKAIASRVRSAVALKTFDDFHKNSSKIIRSSVFGLDERGKVKEKFEFPQNKLLVTSIDIQSVEPVDQRTRDALLKSVQLAIEITTNSQEATARHNAQKTEQEARGKLERQQIEDEAAAEKSRKELLTLKAESAAIESTGTAKAEAEALAESAKIKGLAEVKQAELKSEASKITSEANLDQLMKARDAEIDFMKKQNEMEIEKQQQLSNIETEKFQKMVQSIGADTIKEMATAGPANQVKLLQSLGIQSTIFTDGKSPLNLFNTAQGLVAQSSVSNFKAIQEEKAEDGE